MSVAKSFLKLVKKGEARIERRRSNDVPEQAADDESNWLVSYADMMTLLCGFFIMMFSMSKLDAPQFEPVREAVAKQFGGDFKSPTKALAKFVSQVLDQNGTDKQAILKSDPYGVTIVFKSTVFFDSMGADMRPEGRAVLVKLVESLASRQEMEMKKYKIVVEGHTDSRPVVSGPYPSNWELSASRASKVLRLFLDRGFSPSPLTAIGYADSHPIADARLPTGELNEDAMNQNRRVVVRVLEPKVDAIPMPDGPATTAH
ncbi:flagellar motor protein MotB [Bdellovibrionota bacterium FG-2]